MFGNFKALNDLGVSMGDIMSMLSGDFSNAGKIGSNLLHKFEPNIIEGIENIKTNYQLENVVLLASVQSGVNKETGGEEKAVFIDVASISEDEGKLVVDLKDQYLLKELPTLLEQKITPDAKEESNVTI